MLKQTDGLFRTERLAGLAVALALHVIALWGLWQHRLIPSPQEAMTLFVNIIAPPLPEIKLPPPSKPQPTAQPQLRQIVASAPVIAPTDQVVPPPPAQPVPINEAPVIAPTDSVAPPSPPQPVPINETPAASPAPASTKPAGPVALGGELSVTCPERNPPRYPPLSRRLGEEGTVVLRVELDEQGKVYTARIAASSGFERLDNAALEAVRTWQCRPAYRDGQAVRAVAVQPFKFMLQGN